VKEIILGVTGSIAAYKAADIANDLTKRGVAVHVIMTRAAQKLIAPITFQTLTRHRVYTDLFSDIYEPDVRHISLAQGACLCLVAPATANMIGKIAGGIADDMLSTVVMAMGGKPVLIAPAMNTAMYENPIVQENIRKLCGLNYRFIEPRQARLACGDVGRGALAEVEAIVKAVEEAFEHA